MKTRECFAWVELTGVIATIIPCFTASKFQKVMAEYAGIQSFKVMFNTNKTTRKNFDVIIPVYSPDKEEWKLTQAEWQLVHAVVNQERPYSDVKSVWVHGAIQQVLGFKGKHWIYV